MARTNKFGNIRTASLGRLFASKLEANHAGILEAMKRAKEPHQRVKSVIYQYRIPLAVNGTTIGHYVADFYVLFADGHKEIHESKGFKTPIYKWKKKHVEAQYGEKIYEF